MSRNDSDYLRARAKRERAIASSCEDNSAALVHLRMADEYERRVQSMNPGNGSAHRIEASRPLSSND